MKELLKDSKSKSIVLLFLYLFMMIVIVMITRPVNNVSEPIETKKEENLTPYEIMEQKTNYQYEYIINYDNADYIIKGTRYNNEEIFSYLDKNYYIRKDNIYEINNNVITKIEGSNLLFDLKSELIYKAIKNITPTLELDTNGIISREYYLPNNEDTVKITTYEENNEINKVNIVNDGIESGYINITINYKNIAKINEFNTNFKLEE